MEKKNSFFTTLFLTLFPFTLLAFDYNLYKVVFFIMFLQLASVPFLSSERSRILVWCLNSFLFSYLLIQYGYKVIDNLTLSSKLLILLEESLQIIPILILIYVHKMFKQSIRVGFHSSNWMNRWIILFTIIALIGIMFYFTFLKLDLNILWAIFYCVVHAFLYEVLWRGVILELFSQFLSKITSFILTGIAFGIFLHSFGFSLFISILFAVYSIGFSIMKFKTNSIYPSILVHAFIVFLLYITNYFYIPV